MYREWQKVPHILFNYTTRSPRSFDNIFTLFLKIGIIFFFRSLESVVSAQRNTPSLLMEILRKKYHRCKAHNSETTLAIAVSYNCPLITYNIQCISEKKNIEKISLVSLFNGVRFSLPHSQMANTAAAVPVLLLCCVSCIYLYLLSARILTTIAAAHTHTHLYIKFICNAAIFPLAYFW